MHHPTHFRERLRQGAQLLAVVGFATLVMFLLNLLLGEQHGPAKHLSDPDAVQPVSSPPPPQAPRQVI
ncbi:hypothetical protein ACFONG_14920 [Uliginosibacterium paludis]|uniref:Energy transducer TonB n=1 Tax=Uliginosibacterium paludis TaxID=1615952 RepID=A0ABV2CVW1_9RHOO